MKIAGYIRVSTSQQAKEGESLNTQLQEIKDFAKKKKWELVKIYEDRGISGSKAKSRPGFMGMIKDAENKNFQGICFSRLSRFARNAGDFLFYSERLKDYGVSLFSLKEGIDPSTNTGKLMMGLMALIAEWEREAIREQMAENKMSKWTDNRTFIGKPPFGYVWNKEEKRLEINPKEAELYKRMISMYVDQGLSFKSIASILKEEGIKCKKAAFSSVTISYIFKNPCYYGNYVINKFKYIYNPNNARFVRSKILKPIIDHITFPIPALINKVKWDDIQKKSSSNKVKGKKASSITHLYWLRDMLTCGECGGKIKPHHGSKRKDGSFPRYYSCHWAFCCPKTLALSDRKKCMLPLIKAKELERLIWRGLMRPFAAGLNKKKLEPLFDPAHYERKLNDLDGQITRHKADLVRKEKAKARLWNAFDADDGLFDKNDLSAQLTLNKDQCLEIESRIEELENKKNEIIQIKENDLQAKAFIKDNKKSLKKAYQDIMELAPEDKKILIEGSVKSKIEIALLPGWEKSEGLPKWEIKKNESCLNMAVLQSLADQGKISNIFNKNSSNHSYIKAAFLFTE